MTDGECVSALMGDLLKDSTLEGISSYSQAKKVEPTKVSVNGNSVEEVSTAPINL
jgi:hypothetical protein